MGIFAALGQKLKKDDWIPAPRWWASRNRFELWLALTPEEKLGAWIMATDADYIELAELLLGHPLEPERSTTNDTRPSRDHDTEDRLQALRAWLDGDDDR